MRKWLLPWSLGCLMALSAAGAARAEAQKIFVFGNSLIHHLTESDTTTVPHWMAHFAQHSGRAFALDGQWGFLKEFPEKLPPEPEWRFADVTSAWEAGQSFDRIGYDTIVFNPTNFIQHQSAEKPYSWDNPDGRSPLSAALTVLDQTAAGKKVLIYQGWADIGPFGYPPSRRKLRKFHAYNIGEYHDWYVDFAEQLARARPDLEFEMIPVARVLSRAFTQTGLSGIPKTALYTDDAGHGSATLYYLAAAVTYAGLFDEMPVFGGLPPEVHPLVEPYFNALSSIIAEEVDMSRRKATGSTNALPQQVALLAASQDTGDDANQKAKTEVAHKVTQVNAQTPELSAPNLAMGLNEISDWSTQMPFVNLMKTARPWIGHLPGQWGGWNEDDLSAAGALDPNGWPKRIPDALTAIETLVLTDFPQELTHHNGLYRLRYEGTGKVELTGLARPQRYGEGEIWFRYQAGPGSVGIKITQSDPANTGDYIRNISVVHEDQIPLYELGFQFNPDWLRIVQDLRLLRFMDWMGTNHSRHGTWEARAQPEDYSYMRRGVPLEVMLDLANHIGADAWFNMPHMAEDAYVQRFAQMVEAKLDPKRKVHVEYSNELWNFIFGQTEWAKNQAEATWGADAPGDAWFQFAGLRAAEVMDIWSGSFAGQQDRLVRVAAVHTGWPGLESTFLEAPLDARRPADSFDAYAVSGYIGHELGADQGPEMVLDWLEKSQAAGRGIEGAIEASINHIRENSLAYLTGEAWPYHASIAAQYELDFIMYEGGTHVVGHGEWVDHAMLTTFFTDLNYAPEMGALYQDLTQSWQQAGGEMFNAFVDVASPSKWGSWGALRNLRDETARFDALMAYNHSGHVGAQTRSAQDFAHGTIARAMPEGAELHGTDQDDVLLGGQGDDVMWPRTGSDLLHGGQGQDHAELPGFMEEYRFEAQGDILIARSSFGTTHLSNIESLSFSKMPNVKIAMTEFF